MHFTDIRLVRFAVVGVGNTLCDVVLFTILRFAGLPITLANICSTSVALLLSLVLNYRYTFQGNSLTARRIGLYILVTLGGLWVLQPIIITAVTDWNSQQHVIQSLTQPLGHQRLFVTLLPKLLATAFTLVWNYLWYSRVIFRKAAA